MWYLPSNNISWWYKKYSYSFILNFENQLFSTNVFQINLHILQMKIASMDLPHNWKDTENQKRLSSENNRLNTISTKK